MKRLAILGASGHGKVAADIALQSGWEDVVFFDDDFENKRTLENWPVVGNTQDLLSNTTDYSGVFVAIGNSKIRYTKIIQLLDCEATITSLIHPKAIVSPYASLADGIMVVGGAVVNAFSRIGVAGIVNTGATVGHDCILAEAVHIAPGANVAGGVSIGRHSWIGVGSAVRQGIKIGAEVTVGAGAAVVNDIADGQTVVGVPAKALITRNAILKSPLAL